MKNQPQNLELNKAPKPQVPHISHSSHASYSSHTSHSPTPSLNTSPDNNEGVALVLVLVFIALLAALAVDFTYEMQVEAAFAENRVTRTQAEWNARSAVASCQALLLADRAEDLDQETEVRYDSLTELWAEGVLPEEINGGFMQGLISDEYGKLNLNVLVPPSTDSGGQGANTDLLGNPEPNPILDETLRILFEYRLENREEADAIVDAIEDWLDGDPEIRPAGAEWDYYEYLEVPYAITDGPMRSVEELLLIPGITPDVYFGDPELEQVPLSELLTVYGHPDGEINVNTAHVELLTAMLEAIRSTRTGQDLVEDRDSNPFNAREQLEQGGYIRREEQPGAGAAAPPPIDNPENPDQPRVPLELLPPPVAFRSQIFRLTGDGLVGDTQVRIEAFVWRSPEPDIGDEAIRVLNWRVIG